MFVSTLGFLNIDGKIQLGFLDSVLSAFSVVLPLFMQYLLVAVCNAAWYDDSNCFVAGFIDGVICLATKDPDDQVKIVQAHKVIPINNHIIRLTVEVKLDKGGPVFVLKLELFNFNGLT